MLAICCGLILKITFRSALLSPLRAGLSLHKSENPASHHSGRVSLLIKRLSATDAWIPPPNGLALRLCAGTARLLPIAAYPAPYRRLFLYRPSRLELKQAIRYRLPAISLAPGMVECAATNCWSGCNRRAKVWQYFHIEARVIRPCRSKIERVVRQRQLRSGFNSCSAGVPSHL
jgi:hypothetical protein